ncbi:S24 family peptidase [Phyllobacteriaceae bacterium JZ32]
MNDFFAPALSASAIQSPALRVVPVLGDGMYPTFRGDHDFALMRPVTTYRGEGIYVVSNAFGFDFFRVESTMDGKRGLRLFRDNPHYSDRFMNLEEFEGCVLGIVVADIKVRNHQMLAEGK